jgi:hypothetical protein
MRTDHRQTSMYKIQYLARQAWLKSRLIPSPSAHGRQDDSTLRRLDKIAGPAISNLPRRLLPPAKLEEPILKMRGERKFSPVKSCRFRPFARCWRGMSDPVMPYICGTCGVSFLAARCPVDFLVDKPSFMRKTGSVWSVVRPQTQKWPSRSELSLSKSRQEGSCQGGATSVAPSLFLKMGVRLPESEGSRESNIARK